MPIKSSRLRCGGEPPPRCIPLRCTGSLGVASDTCQVLPPSSVVATYKCHNPGKALSSGAPAVVDPRKAYAARASSPATIAGKATALIPTSEPTSKLFFQFTPLLSETETPAMLSPLPKAAYTRPIGCGFGPPVLTTLPLPIATAGS